MSISYNIPGGEDLANVDKDNSKYRVGRRIRTIRQEAEMSQGELGEKVGLNANRIQQYENGIRKPKFPLLKKLATALNVNVLALMDPNMDAYVNAMHLLFQMEEELDAKLILKDGCYYLMFGNGKTGGINDYLQNWYNERQKLYENFSSISDVERQKRIKEYNQYEWSYPQKIML